MRTICLLLLVTLLVIIGCTGCGHPAEKKVCSTVALNVQQRLDTCRSDTDKFMVLGERVEAYRTAGQLDSALQWVDSLRSIAGKDGRLRARAEVVALNARLYLNDTAARSDALQLVVSHANDSDKAVLSSFQEFMGLVYTRTGQALAADSILQLAEENARQGKDTLRWAEVMAERMTVLNNLGKNREAMAKGEEALRIVPLHRDPSMPATVLAERGNAYRALGMVDSAIASMRQCLALAEEQHDTLMLVASGYNLAEYLTDQAQYAASLDLRLRTLARAQAPGVAAYQAPIRFGMGRTYQLMHRLPDALDAFHEAEALARNYGMQDLWPLAQAGRASIWAEMDSAQRARLDRDDLYASARETLDSAMSDIAPTGLVQYAGDIEKCYGDVARVFKDHEVAIKHYERARSLFTSVGHGIGLSDVRSGLGAVHLAAGHFRDAIEQLNGTVDFARTNSMKHVEADALHTMHEAQQKLGRTADALASLQRAYTLSEEARNDSTVRAIANLEADFTYRQKQYADSLSHAAEIREKDLIATRAQLGEAQANNRTLFIGSIALLLLGGGYAFYRNRQQRVRSEAALAIVQANERLAQEKLRTAEFQNKALRAQMEPHFIRNTIGLAIARLRKKSETSVDDASELLASFSEWIDRALVTSQHAAHALAEEFKGLSTYLDLQRLRMNGSFNYTVHVDAGIDAQHTQVPPMLLQPLLENAIEYGLEPQEGRGNLRLSAERKDGGLLLSVEDDGVGRNHPKPERPRTRSASISTANIREQLAQLSQRTGKPAEMRIIDLPKGTRVEVLLPM